MASALLVIACGRESSVAGNRGTASASPVSVEDVRITGTNSDFFVFYRTRTSIRDQEAQIAEIPKVWDSVVRPRLKASTTRVTMMPEDPSGTSVSFTFTNSAGGGWTALAPWKIVIPAKASPGLSRIRGSSARGRCAASAVSWASGVPRGTVRTQLEGMPASCGTFGRKVADLMEVFPGISMNPDVRFGKPCIAGDTYGRRNGCRIDRCR